MIISTNVGVCGFVGLWVYGFMGYRFMGYRFMVDEVDFKPLGGQSYLREQNLFIMRILGSKDCEAVKTMFPLINNRRRSY
jgi:hypothetical protein